MASSAKVFAIAAALSLSACFQAAAQAWDGSTDDSLAPLSQTPLHLTRPAPCAQTDDFAATHPFPGGAIAPQLVHDVAAFALTSDDLNQIAKALPAKDSPLGQELASIMRRAYIGGATPPPFEGKTLRVITWNINAAHTQSAVDAILAVADGSPEGVQQALGRKSALTAKAKAQLAEVSQNDVFFMQEIPLPTAIKLADRLQCQVFWVPEFLEVGDNAKGRDPGAADIYTGNAILSRVPLSDFRILRFAHQADWYDSQKGPQPLGQKLEKTAASVLFAADAGNPHQTRPPLPYGGRVALFARTAAKFQGNDGSSQEIWVGDLHLEDLGGQHVTGPQLRRQQMAEAREFTSSIDGPVIFGGDLNTMGDSPGVVEGEDLVIEGPNLMHVSQAPVARQSSYASGVGDKFQGVVDGGDLVTTLTHSPGKRKGLVAEQTADLAIDVVPYAPTVHDGISAAQKIKQKPGDIPRDAFYAGMTAADFFPYTAAGAKGFQIFMDERSRHNPTSLENADHGIFHDVKSQHDVQILNPTLGFRFGMGGYPATWTAGRPMMIPGLSRGLANAVVDWLFLSDPSHQMTAPKGQVLKDLVVGSAAGSKDEQRLSDHYPLRAQVPLTQTGSN